MTTLLRPLLLALFALCLSATASAQTYTQAQLQEIYRSHLATEGYRAEITPAGNVKFKREGRTVVIYVEEKDPTYFRMAMSFAESDKSAAARTRRLEAANLATSEVKVAKVYLDNDGDPAFSVEMFVIVPGDFKTMFDRLLKVMDLVYEKYTTKFNAR